MGFLFRAALVIGVIYALSPVSAPLPGGMEEEARAVLADPARAVAAKALEACLARPDVCARLANGPATTGSTSPAPHAAAPARPGQPAPR